MLEYVLLDSKLFPPAQIIHNIQLSSINDKYSLLLMGSVDSRIHICVFQSNLMSKCDIFFNNIHHLNGHEEWVTCLCTKVVSNTTLLLASGSKDAKIRLWKMILHSNNINNVTISLEAKFDEMELEDDIGEDIDEEDGDVNKIIFALEEENISESRLNIDIGTDSISFYLESLLVGHEDWVTSVTWLHDKGSLRLFSTSMDRNMVIWSPDDISGGVWVPSIRVGDIGGALGGSIGYNYYLFCIN